MPTNTLGSTNQSFLSSDSLGLTETETASISFDPLEAFFTTTSLLELVQDFSPEESGLNTDVINSLDQVSGTLAFEGGVVMIDLATPEGAVQESIDTIALFNDFAQLAAGINGTLDINQGVLNYELTNGQETFVDVFNLTEFATDWISSLLFELETTTTFANGFVPIDASTPFGDVTGNVGFAGGQLSLDLNTPAGELTTAVDFGDDAQISLDENDAVILDFNSGQLLINLSPIPLPGSEIAIPLENLAGTVEVDDGIGTVTVSTPFGEFGESIELGPMASELAADFLNDLSGSAVVENGVLIGSLVTPLGLLEGDINFPQLADQGAEFMSQLTGTVTVSEGLAISNLDTSLGPINGTLDLNQLAAYLTMPVSEIV